MTTQDAVTIVRKRLSLNPKITRMAHKVFVSWSGSAGSHLASALHETILSFPGLDPWVSSIDIHDGKPWFQSIDEAMTDAAVGVVLLTPRAQASSWVYFEAGFLYAKLQSCIVLRCGEDARGPLKVLQSSDALNKASLTKAMRSILLKTGTSGEERATRDAASWVNMHWDEWFKEANHLLRPKDDLDIISLEMVKRINDLPGNPLVQSSSWMRQVLSMSLRRAFDSLSTGSRHEIPAVHYPMYLLEFQHHGAKVRALALLEREEFFWLLDLGHRLAKTAHPESQRIFIFDNIDQFDKYQDILRLHAHHYNVFAISRDTIAKIIPVSKDFSVIMDSGASQNAVLAEYDSSQAATVVRFDFDLSLINNHLGFLDDVQRSAEEIAKDFKLDDLRDKIFGPSFVQYTRRPVEMSEYISVRDYDQHEEKHAYYLDMMSQTIDIILQNRKHKSMFKCRILEFGAGTGILTTRLASISDVEIHAVEIDWHCYQVLVDKIRQSGAMMLEFSSDNRQHKFAMPNGNTVVTYNEDSRSYNPSGRYDYIVSSFADHHIKASDKQVYFANVKQNLEAGALYIVGDEFLRDHDPSNDNEWRDALHAYHEHIINIALSEGENVLAELENQALQSGLERRGDFKLSLSQYIGLLQSEGFIVESKCIGPSDPSLTGGVYICTASSN